MGRSPRLVRVGLLTGSAKGLGAALPRWPFGPWSGGPALQRTTSVRLTRRESYDLKNGLGGSNRDFNIIAISLFKNWHTFSCLFLQFVQKSPSMDYFIEVKHNLLT
jgi:hypothetical protein